MQPQRAQLRKVMRETFGVKNLREGQEEVMQSVLKGQNTLAIMPTGAGKSLYFQLPALLMPGTTIVVSPLIALELNSSLPQAEQALNVKAAAGGKTDFLYVTPERLTKPTFLQSIRKMKIDLVVIDEAHCVSQWGHDFRPAYLALRDVLTTLGNPPVLALTATATEDVIEDIEKQLALKDLRVFKSGVLRDNLHYETVHVEKETDKPERLVELLKSTPGNGIIYCATIKMVEETTEFLKSRGLSVTRYHGKLPAKERHLNQDLFMQGDVPLIVATNAFGMGIDKSNIRFVIHLQFPGSLEAYYQESGRAGRDGEDSRCILFYLRQDKRTQSFFLAGKYPKPDDIRAVFTRLKSLSENGLDINHADLTKDLEVAPTKLRVILTAMKEAGFLTGKRQSWVLHKPHLTEGDLAHLVDEYQRLRESDQEKLKQIIVYSQTALCRWKFLLRYFGQEVDWQCCGHCDNCHKEASHLVEPNLQITAVAV